MSPAPDHPDPDHPDPDHPDRPGAARRRGAAAAARGCVTLAARGCVTLAARGCVTLAARGCVTLAARRWPADLRAELAAAWRAELAALAGGTAPGGGRRAAAFALSLLVAPAVERDGEPAAGWAARGRTAAAAAGVTLLAAALFSGVQLGRRLVPAGDAARPVVTALLLAAAAAVLVAAAPRTGRPVRWTVLLGGGLAGFLLAGNRVAMMPFMGWRDVLPAAAVWTASTAVVAVVVARLAASRPAWAVVAGTAGGLLAVDAATAAGAAHAAAVLGVDLAGAPWWLPLALLPAGTAPPVSGVLLGGVAATAGPLLLATAFVVAVAVRGARPRGAAPAAAAPPVGAAGRTAAGAGAALAALAVAELLRRTGEDAASLPGRLAEQTAVFGFGFLHHPPGRAAVALLAGLLAAHAVRRRVTAG